MKVIIVDDEPAARRTLRECCEREGDLAVIGEYGDTTSALAGIAASAPDLLLLDIQIDSQSGIGLARALPAAAAPLIVFVTAFDHYALEAFDVSAVDYLLKPFDEERFRRTLERVRARHAAAGSAGRQEALAAALELIESRARTRAAPRPRLLAEAGSRMHMLDAGEIEAVEADRNYVRLTVGQAVFHTRSTLAQAERSLQSQPMLRISRSCLVNVTHVKEISRTPRGDFILVMAGGTTLTSSEGFRDCVRQYLQTLKLAPA
jgi:two-component system, LytTR family, response regulator